jgi:hypothetical protein
MLQLRPRNIARTGIVEVQVFLLKGFLTRGTPPMAMYDSKRRGWWRVCESPSLGIRAVLGLFSLAPQASARLFAVGLGASDELVHQGNLEDHAAMSCDSGELFALLKNALDVGALFLVGVKPRSVANDLRREIFEDSPSLGLCCVSQ